MFRTIMIFPEFSNMEIIDSIRLWYDPLANLIRPHITIVFPFESDMSNEELSEVLEERLKDIEPFDIELKGFTKHSEESGKYLFLNMTVGAEAVKNIHDLLYANEFKPFDPGYKYVPHITVGKFDSEQMLNSAYEHVKSIDDLFMFTVGKISVEMIGEHNESIIIIEKELKKNNDSGKSDFPRFAFGGKREKETNDLPVSMETIRKSFKSGDFKETRLQLSRLDRNDKDPEADLIRILSCYRVGNAEALMHKVCTGGYSVKLLFTRSEMKKLASDLLDSGNDIVAHMVQYCFLSLMLSGRSAEDILPLFDLDPTSIRMYPSGFKGIDREDVANFKRTRAIEAAKEPYEMDVIEELDDIRVKFKSAIDNPDRNASSIASANAHLLLDLFTLGARIDQENNPESYYANGYAPLREHDYGVNAPPRNRQQGQQQIAQNASSGLNKNSAHELYLRLQKGFPERDDKLRRRSELMEMIREEEKLILQ